MNTLLIKQTVTVNEKKCKKKLKGLKLLIYVNK